MEMNNVLDALSKSLFKLLHQMDDEADDSSGKRHHAGLTDYSIYKGLSGKQYEKSWNDRLAGLLRNGQVTTDRETRYPNSKKKCDIVITLPDNILIWLEVKSAWKYWFSSISGKVEDNSQKWYRPYLLGDANEKYSVAHDIMKLNKLNAENANYLGLLTIGFDISSDPINPDMEQLIKEKSLKENGWNIYGSEIWPDRNHPNCRYNCWFFGKVMSD
jgi:hypothetical protein